MSTMCGMRSWQRHMTGAGLVQFAASRGHPRRLLIWRHPMHRRPRFSVRACTDGGCHALLPLPCAAAAAGRTIVDLQPLTSVSLSVHVFLRIDEASSVQPSLLLLCIIQTFHMVSLHSLFTWSSSLVLFLFSRCRAPRPPRDRRCRTSQTYSACSSSL